MSYRNHIVTPAAVALAVLCLVSGLGHSKNITSRPLSWTNMQAPSKIDSISDGVFFDTLNGVVTARKTWRTTDGGRTWRVVAEQGFTQMAFVDNRVGFACAGGWNRPPGLVFKTEDGGFTWTEVFRGPKGLHSIAVGDRDHVVAGSPWHPDTVWVTVDGGKTWQERKGAGGDRRGTIIATGSSQFYALNLHGQLARSTDGGLTWSRLAKLKKRAHQGHLLQLSDTTLLVSGCGPNLLRSGDGGKSFMPIADTPSGGALSRGGDGHLLLAGDNGVWESTDRGATWRKTFTTTLIITGFGHAADTWWVFGGKPGRVGFWPVALLLRKGPPLPEDMGGNIVPIQYKLERDGFVTLTIENAAGIRVRNLIANQPRTEGKHVDYWDGRDEWGQVAPAGKYRWRGLTHTGLHLSYEFAFNTPGSPPWETGGAASNGALSSESTGGWGADHRNPQAVTAVGDKMILGWPMSEGGSRVNAVEAHTGRKLWNQKRRLILGNHYGGSAIALAADETFVYVALQTKEGGIGFCRLNVNNGQEVKFQRTENGRRVHEIDHVCNGKPAPRGKVPAWIEQYQQSLSQTSGKSLQEKPDRTIAQNGKVTTSQGWNAATANGSLRGCAVDDRHVYISSYWDNAIYVCDKRTAANVNVLKLDRPAGLAVGPDGALYAIIGDKLVSRIDIESGGATTVVRGLNAPLGLAIDKDGQFYVSERGAAMNVKVFDRGGNPIRTVGKTGGRAIAGPYQSDGMLMPWGVSVDKTGRLWVAEEDFAPRRISVWNSDGRLNREFIGRSTYGATGAAVNPDDPNMAIDTGTIFELDWENGSYKPVYSLPRMGWHRGAIFGWPYPGGTAKPHAKARFLRHAGRQYLLLEGRPMMVLERVGERWLFRAALGTLHGVLDNCGRGKTEIDLSLMPGYDPKTWETHKWPPARSIKNYHFIWCDVDGDGLLDANEIQTRDKAEGVWSNANGRFADDLTAQLGPYAIAPSGETACGAPLYRFADLKASVQVPKERANGWQTWLKSPGGWLIASGYVWRAKTWKTTPTPKIPGLMGGYNPEGKRTWFYPSYFQTHGSFGAPPPHRGLFVGDWYYGGVVDYGGELGEVFHVAGNLGQHYLFTVDGLYISEIFLDARSGPITPGKAIRGMSLDNMSNQTEGWLGGFFRHPKSNRTYVLSCPNHASGPVISEVTGLDSIQRLQGMLAVAPEQVARARENPPAGVTGKLRPGTIAKAQKSPAIDGVLDEWDFVRSFGIPVDAKRGARAAISYDKDNLYLAYDVRDPFPLRNNGTDPLLLFKSGTAVDLMLATDSKAASSRRNSVKGDLRLLFSVMGDTPVAVLYRPVAPGATNGSSFSSPGGRVEFDSVRALNDARIAFRRGKKGFTLEAAVPLKTLGWHPMSGSVLRGDVGVIYSDDIGSQNILRSYWSNKVTNLTADVGYEARLTPAEWNEMQIE
jgi:photosystem II stability/assembly factor-like uncharacterized protein/sugar lactone lactonase YvrE